MHNGMDSIKQNQGLIETRCILKNTFPKQYVDEIHVTGQACDNHCSVGGRLWLSEDQRQVKEQVAWLSDSTRTARVVAV